MNRRDFLKLMAAGATPFAVSMLCNLPIDTLAPSASVKPTRTPKVGTPTATALPPSEGVTRTPGTVPAPAGGLGGNSNYYISGDCKPITGLSVTIDFEKDVVTDIGFSIQLNAYSPQGANCAYQQYCMRVATSNGSPVDITASMENWPSDSFRKVANLPTPGDLVNTHNQPMLSLSEGKLPAGYKFTISLEYDQNQNVSGANYLVV